MPEKEIDLLIKDIDINKDNEIDYNEFFEMMKRGSF
jgi:Ca2+-binding EF-hand superfamily protein